MQQTIIEAYLKKIRQSMFKTKEVIAGWKFRTAEYIGPNDCKRTSDWMDLHRDRLFAVDETVFMETWWHVPENLRDNEEHKDYLLLLFKNFEGLVCLNDKPYHGVDRNRDRIPLPRELSGCTVKLSMELSCVFAFDEIPEQPMFLRSELVTVDRRIEKFYYDLKLAWEALACIGNEYCRLKVMAAIDLSLQSLDLTLAEAEYVDRIIAADRQLTEAIARIDDKTLKGKISLIGHTHIDVAWLWQLKDTVRKTGRTFSNMLRLMEEFPRFKFTCSQPQLYDYMKMNYPDLYEEVKKRVAAGSWEIVGPMWVESDCNLISGESIVRQLLYGHDFFQREFGITSPICWLPDTFGFQANMPQILQKGGIKYFFSYKLHWQSENGFPFGAFKWRGIDGTEVLSAIPDLKSGYNGHPSPDHLAFATGQNPQKGLTDEVILPYGWGDGGGGPDRDMAEYAVRLQNFPGLPSASLDFAGDYFGKLEQQSDRLPVWDGELYHESHRGTYTSVGRAKKLNRQCEQLYRQLEIVNVWAEAGGKAVPWAKVKAHWKTMLTLQFHDILPGSSIREVYEDADDMYDQVIRQGNALLEEGLAFLAKSANERRENTITVFNTLSWERKDKVSFVVDSASVDVRRLKITASGGRPVDFVALPAENGRRTIQFVADAVPSIGYTNYRIHADHDGPATANASPNRATPGVAAADSDHGVTVENRFFLLAIDNDGTLARLFDKTNGREVLTGQGKANEFRLFLDGPQTEDAWNIYSDYRSRRVEKDWENTLNIAEQNDVRTVVRLVKRQERVVIEQNIILYHQLDTIDFVTRVIWQEKHKVLKVAFPVEVLSPAATYEIGFGAIQRPTHANTRYEQAKFEVYGHKWVDLSEEGYGVSLLNDCKYGHDIQNNIISMTLLRGTDCPYSECDTGIHEFTYSLYPHRDDWRKGRTVRRGWELNSPLLAAVSISPSPVGEPETGLSPGEQAPGQFAELSYFRLDNPNVVLDTIKPAEDSQGIILRFYECNGSRGQVRVDTCFRPEGLEECNLLEVAEKTVEVSDRTFFFCIKPYEVKTFRMRIRPNF